LQLLYDEAWRLVPFQKMTLCVDKAVQKFLEQDLSPQLMQVRLSWRLKRKREKDYTFWHQFDEKRSIVLGCSDWHCNLCTLRPGGLFQKTTLCVDEAVEVLLGQDLSTYLTRVCFRPQSVLLMLGGDPKA